MVARGPLTVICGPNNTGKSSLLSALTAYPAWCRAVARGGQEPPANRSTADGARARVAIDTDAPAFVELAESQLGDQVQIALDALRTDGSRVWIELRRTGSRIDLEVDCLTRLNGLLQGLAHRGNDAAGQAVRALGGEPAISVGWTWARNMVGVLPIPEVKLIEDVRRTAAEPLTDEQLFGLAQASSRSTAGQRRERWADTLALILRDVFGPDTLYEVTPQPGRGDFLLHIDGQHDLPLNHAGAGVREVVAIAHAALTGDPAPVLCIEEPENCLHPNAVRRLLDSLVQRTEAQLFVTTHAAAVVNARPDAIVQLSRVGDTTTSTQVDRPSRQFEAIRALGYSPADLVLTPCVLWVEGPSDRLYLTEWLAAHDLVEGVDYQAMAFGGALGTHLTAAADVEPGEALTAIRQLSRRCVVVTDSDRAAADAPLTPFVQRFTEELAADEHGLHLVTPGREVENYLPLEVVNRVRAAHRAPALATAETDHRYHRVVESELNKRLSKVAFAREALALLAGEIPPAAKDDVERIATFIRTSEPRHAG
ncbi:MAG TPA: AAA family ATPase [Acidimicrobiales bacterium]|nr:AAA family ATPase [Acidimicrobiales bacterium]